MENEKYMIRYMVFVLKGGGFFLMLFGWFIIFKYFVIFLKSGRGDIVYVEEFDFVIFGILIKGILYFFKI